MIAFGQLGVYLYQAKQLREAVNASVDQSKAMERHIAEAARSADAMGTIADKIEAGNQAVMRAYLTVNIGGAMYQERGMPGQPDIKFEGKPQVVNTGNTQARNVRIKKRSAILPAPAPNGFDYPEIPDQEFSPFATLAAHSFYTISQIVDDFIPDNEVADVKEGTGKALQTWGVISYDDIFGKSHTTKFGQTLTWLADGKTVYGYFTPGQNDSD